MPTKLEGEGGFSGRTTRGLFSRLPLVLSVIHHLHNFYRLNICEAEIPRKTKVQQEKDRMKEKIKKGYKKEARQELNSKNTRQRMLSLF